MGVGNMSARLLVIFLFIFCSVTVHGQDNKPARATWLQLLQAGKSAPTFAEKSPTAQLSLRFQCPVPAMHILDCWLNSNPKVAQQLRWWIVKPNSVSGKLEALAWPDWDDSHKKEFRKAFDDYLTWLQNGMGSFPGSEFAEIIPNRLHLDDEDDPKLNMDYATGWLIFRSYAAHALAAEILGRYPWSLAQYNEEELQDILLGKEFGLTQGNPPVMAEGFTFAGYDVTPARPSTVMEFLKDKGLQQATVRQSIGALLRFMRDYCHYPDGKSTLNMEIFWGYRGPPPMMRILNGTIPKDERAQIYPDGRHWMHGCHGSANFQIWILRLFNIPARTVLVCGHDMPYYPSISAYLSHGDDPYSSLSRAPPDYEGAELLVTPSQFNAWFPTRAEDYEAPECVNVGHKSVDLGVKHIPEALINIFCQDLKLGKSHFEGDVFQLILSKYYSMAELNSQDFWTRLNDRAKAEGRCSETVYSPAYTPLIRGQTVKMEYPPDEIPLPIPGPMQ
jgi:hypothetical protein